MKVSPIVGCHLVVLLMIVHLLLGFRRLREVDYYRDDPIAEGLVREIHKRLMEGVRAGIKQVFESHIGL